MFWFDVFFSPAMIVMPMATCLVMRPPRQVHDEVDWPSVRRLRGRIMMGTAAALGVFAVVWFALGPHTARFMWFLSAPLFTLSMRLMNEQNPHWQAHTPKATVRTVSLTPRTGQSPVPRFVFAIIWLIWIAALGLVLARLSRPFEGRELLVWWCTVVTVSTGVLPAILGPWSIKRVMEEAEPRDASGSLEIEQAYAAHRSFRAWGFAGLSVVMELMTSGMAVGLVWLPEQARSSEAVIWVGAGGGCLIGLLGAAWGVACTLKRARISMLVRGEPNGRTR